MVSLGIITYNRPKELLNLLNSFKVKNQHFEKIYLVDNNETQDFFKTHYFDKLPNGLRDQIIYFSTGENLGVARGRDQLLKLCKERILVFLDDDLIIPDVEKLIGNIKCQIIVKKAQGVSSKIIDHSTNQINPREFPHPNKNLLSIKSFETYIFIGACFGIDCYYLREKGLDFFQTNLNPYGMEEIDLAYRIINAGGKIMYDSNVEVIHLNSPNGRFARSRQLYMVCENRIHLTNLYFHWPFRFSNRMVWSFYYLFKDKNLGGFLSLLFCRKGRESRNMFKLQFYKRVWFLKGRILY
jgi:GT2 family glycosyltransferase